MLSHELSVCAGKVLEPTVLTEQSFPANRYNQNFLHIKLIGHSEIAQGTEASFTF